MCQQNQGKPSIEPALLGLVAEQEHSQQTAQAAAKYTNSPKPPLRDPGKTVYGIVLVHKHNHQSQRIDYNEINKDWIHK